MDRIGSEMGQHCEGNPPNSPLYKSHVPRPARRKWQHPETSYETALKAELKRAQAEIKRLAARLQWVSDKLKVSQAMNQQKKERIEQIKHKLLDKGRPRTKPDPSLIKLTEAERVIALNVINQFKKSANKEMYLTKLKFAIGIDPLEGYNGPTSKDDL